jgi:hypothetical protein
VSFDAGIGQQERLGEVIPDGVAGEVPGLGHVPLGRHAEAGERAARAGSLLGDCSLKVPHDHVSGIDAELKGPVRPAGWGEADVPASGAELHRLLAENAGLSLGLPEGAADRHVRGDPGHLRPAAEAAVRLDDLRQKLVHFVPVVVVPGYCRPGQRSNARTSRPKSPACWNKNACLAWLYRMTLASGGR